MTLISVIVPVYNVEKYLDQCIRSIVNQTYKKLEIILVDDGSTDQSGQICERWANEDSRIQVLHISNGGAGRARNKGMEVATGEWISFVDSDDYIEIHMLEHLYQLCDDNVDLVECCIVKTTNDEADFSLRIEDKTNIIRCTSEEALRYHIEDKLFQQTPPNKIYRKDIVKKFPFPMGKLIDDEYWTYKVIGQARNLVHTNRKLYAYRQHDNSVMHEAYSIKRMQALEAKRERADYVASEYPSLISESEINYWLSCIFQGQMILRHLRGKERSEAWELLKCFWKKNRLSMCELKILTLDYKLWAICSKISIYLACIFRNVLKKGI